MGCGASTPAGSGGADGAPLAASGAPGDRKSVGRASARESNFRGSLALERAPASDPNPGQRRAARPRAIH